MNNRWIVVSFIVLVFLVAASGCNNGSQTADPGTLDVAVLGIDGDVVALGTAGYWVALYFAGTDDVYNLANMVAINDLVIGNTDETLRLKVPDGNWNPTTEDWVGEPGWGEYQCHILIDLNGNGEIDTGIGERTNIPSSVLIDGNTSITFDYFNHLIER
ncbi:MAG: hypothetical protein PF508_09540 [Spirochaeta sp.]|jgi:hypothetical protein|nr:hypothetical protein [Spirochaeta sp.]